MILRGRLITGSALTLAGLVLVAGLAWAQANAKTQTGEIQADTMTLNWDTRTFVFTGSAQLKVAGPYDATLTGSKMTVKLTPNNDKVASLVADGPVSMTLVSNPDAEGKRMRINANAEGQADYAEETQKIVLRGGARATMVSLPEGPESQRASFAGEVLEANLKTSTLTLVKAQLKVSAPMKEE